MHTLGKVFLFLIVLFAAASAVLTAKLIDIRQSWSQQIEGVKKENIQLASRVEEQRKALADARGKLTRTVLGWDRYWTDVPTTVNSVADTEILAEGLGTEQGLKADNPDLILHAFRPVDEAGNEFVYVGPFRVAQVNQNDSALRLAWRPHPGEIEQWQPGNWRFRTMIPPGSITRFGDLRRELTVSQELLDAKRSNLTIQTELVQAAEKQLQERQGELLGDANAREVPNKPEYSTGLVATMEEEEEARNRALAEVDRLRRELKAAEDAVRELMEINKGLAERLPGATTPTAQPGPENARLGAPFKVSGR